MATVMEDFTLALKPAEGDNNARMGLPDGQLLPGGQLLSIALPAGLHTIQLLWRGDITPITLRLADGSANGRVIGRLPGGEDSPLVTVSVAIPQGGMSVEFRKTLAVTAQQAEDNKHALGVTAYLNPAYNL
jgi:hypothetical protein